MANGSSSNTIEFLLTAKNQASPEFKQVTADLTAMTASAGALDTAFKRATVITTGYDEIVKNAKGVVSYGEAWGTAAGKITAGANEIAGAGAVVAGGATAAAGGLARVKPASDAASAGLQSFLTQALQPLGQAFPAVTSLITKFTGSMSTIEKTGVGIAAVGGAVAGLIHDFSRTTEALDNMSHQTGLSVDALEALKQAARESGEGFETVAPQLGRINLMLAELSKGNVDAVQENFNALNLDFEALVKSGASADQILETIAKRIGEIPDPTARAAAQADIFGGRSRAMDAIIKALSEGSLTQLIAKMREVGVVTDEASRNAARAIDEFGDRVDRKFQGVKTQVEGGLSVMAIEFAGFVERFTTTWQKLDTGSALGNLITGVAAFGSAISGVGTETGQILDDITKKTEAGFTQLQTGAKAGATAEENLAFAAAKAAKEHKALADALSGLAPAAAALGPAFADIGQHLKNLDAATSVNLTIDALEKQRKKLLEAGVSTAELDRLLAGLKVRLGELKAAGDQEPLARTAADMQKAADKVRNLAEEAALLGTRLRELGGPGGPGGQLSASLNVVTVAADNGHASVDALVGTFTEVGPAATGFAQALQGVAPALAMLGPTTTAGAEGVTTLTAALAGLDDTAAPAATELEALAPAAAASSTGVDALSGSVERLAAGTGATLDRALTRAIAGFGDSATAADGMTGAVERLAAGTDAGLDRALTRAIAGTGGLTTALEDMTGVAERWRDASGPLFEPLVVSINAADTALNTLGPALVQDIAGFERAGDGVSALAETLTNLGTATGAVERFVGSGATAIGAYGAELETTTKATTGLVTAGAAFTTSLHQVTLAADGGNASVTEFSQSFTGLDTELGGAAGAAREFAKTLVDQGNPALLNLEHTAEGAATAIGVLTGSLSAALGPVESLGASFADVADTIKASQQEIERFKAIEAITNLFQAGRISAEQYQRTLDGLTRQIDTLTTSHKPLPEVVKATGAAMATTSQAVDAFGDSATKAAAGAGAAATATTEFGGSVGGLGAAVDATAQKVSELFDLGGAGTPLATTIGELIKEGAALEQQLDKDANAARNLTGAGGGGGGTRGAAPTGRGPAGGGGPTPSTNPIDQMLLLNAQYQQQLAAGMPLFSPTTPSAYPLAPLPPGSYDPNAGTGGGGGGGIFAPSGTDTGRPITVSVGPINVTAPAERPFDPGAMTPPGVNVNVPAGSVDLPSFQGGGVIPGFRGQPRLVVGHGQERVLPPEDPNADRRAGVGNTVNNVHISIAGHVIQQERDWNTLVERLGQSLDARQRRVYR